jgi:transposase
MHFVEHVPKKQIARRLGVDIKTVRRALERDEAPSARHSPPRGRRLDPWRTAIEAWLKEEPRLSAKRIGRLLEPEAGRVPERTVREYVASVRGTLFPREAFVHRTHRAGDTMEGDFFDTAAVVAGELCRLKVFVGTLPASNVYFAKAYRVERRECLMDGTHESFVFFGGVPRRVVYDNTSLAVKRVLPGRERAEADAFHAFRGGYPFHADYCAPARGNEKGSVEAGVRYVRGLFFRPRPEYESLEQLNAALRAELEVDLDRRQLRDGRTAREAWLAEREHLRPLPPRPPERCRIEARTADKFGHVRVDRAIYSVPIAFAYKAVWAKVYPDRIDLAVDDAVVASHVRCFDAGGSVLDPRHVLPLLERKHRAVSEATALRAWALPEAFAQLRDALAQRTRKPDREWVQVLRLTEAYPLDELAAAVEAALEADTPRLESVRYLLRRDDDGVAVPPVPLKRPDLVRVEVAAPDLAAYDRVWRDD